MGNKNPFPFFSYGGVCMTSKKYSRKLKKKRKKALQKEIRALNKYDEKKIKKESYSSLISIAEKEHEIQRIELEKKELKKQKRKEAKQKLRNRKKDWLESKGINVWDLRLKDIDSVKVKDIESNTFNREKYPQFFGLKNFDFTKQIYFDGKEMLLAYRDYQMETDLRTILSEWNDKTDLKLMDRLEQIAKLEPAYKRTHESNGSAGDCIFDIKPRVFLRDTSNKIGAEKRKSKVKEHTGNFKGYQQIKPSTGDSYFSHASRHKMLVVMNAFLHNVNEWNRVETYTHFYEEMERYDKEFASILPKPLY